MSEAEDLLNSLSNDATAYTSRSGEEPHIVIDEGRNIIVPESLQRIAVQFDHNIETVTFDCPRYWDDNDLTELYIYINYQRSDGIMGRYLAKNVVVDDTDSNMIHFDWTISNEITAIKGKLVILVCAVETDSEGMEERHWNSEKNTQMTVSEGLECTEVIPNEYPDIVTDLLTRMDSVVAANTPILDKSLMQAGLAADAKSAGDAIRAIDDRVTQISEGSEFTEIIGNPIQIDVVSKNKCIVTPVGPAIEQNGTPSSNNHIPVLGMGSMEEINLVDVCNGTLVDPANTDGVTCTIDKKNQTITLNGTRNDDQTNYAKPIITNIPFSNITSGSGYKITLQDVSGSYTGQIGINIRSDTEQLGFIQTNNNTSGTSTWSFSKAITSVNLYFNSAFSASNYTFKVMLQKDTDEKPYTPYNRARTQIHHYGESESEGEKFNLDLPIGMVLYDGDMIYEEDGNWYHHHNEFDVEKITSNTTVTQSGTNNADKKRWGIKPVVPQKKNTTGASSKVEIYSNIVKNGSPDMTYTCQECVTYDSNYIIIYLDECKAMTLSEFKVFCEENDVYVVYPLAESYDEKITDSTLISQLNELSTMTTHKGINNFVLTSAGKDGLMKLEYKLYNLIGYEDIEEFDIDISELKRQMGDVSSVLNKINGEEV